MSYLENLLAKWIFLGNLVINKIIKLNFNKHFKLVEKIVNYTYISTWKGGKEFEFRQMIAFRSDKVYNHL